MWCWSVTSCAQRFSASPFEMSSAKWPHNATLGGIFSAPLDAKLNPWAHANKVYVGYCSSDGAQHSTAPILAPAPRNFISPPPPPPPPPGWVGNLGASAATGGFAFRGQAIIEATLQDLAANHGLNGSSQVLFGGCSAGGRGAMFTLDYVAAMLPLGASVKGLLDSPLWLDLEPLDTFEVSLQDQTAGVFALVNPGARIPPACAAAYPGAEGWKCLYGQFRLPFMQTPYFINANGFDSFQMLYDLGGGTPSGTSQVYFADVFQNATRAALAPALLNSSDGAFSTSCLFHCLTDNTTLYTSALADGRSIVQVLGSWYFGLAGATSAMSTCTGYPCVGEEASCPGGAFTYGLAAATSSQMILDAHGGVPTVTSTEEAAKAAAVAAAGSGGGGAWGSLFSQLP